MSLLIDKEMPSVCKKCKEQGKLAGGLYHVHTEDNFINAYCDGDPSTGCQILCGIPDKHGRLKDESVIIQKAEDAFCKLFPMDGKNKQEIASEFHKAFLKAVFDAPTVVEATE